MKKLWHILILLTVVLVGCNKTDDLWDEVHDLQKRLTKLEVQVNNLNGNITALQELYKNGSTITKVEEANGTYTITLSNGKVLKVVQKMEETIYPMVGIDANGYWTVQYGKGTPQQILVDGKPVKAVGDDGLTPEFRINEDTGYWEVRYKTTDEFVTVKDTSGNPVKAEAATNTGFFKSAGTSADGKSFDLTLKDGTEISVPIVSSFSCTFKDITEGVQKFNSEEMKTFTVVLNGVDNLALMAVPTGWVAELSEPANNEATLTVTAPKVVAQTTRATASTSSDISILANSGKFSTILKMQVEAIAPKPVEDNYSMYKAGTLIVDDITINETNFPNVIDLDGSMTDLSTTLKDLSGNTVLFLSGTNVFKTGSNIVSLKDKDVVLISKKPNEKPALEIGCDIRLQDNSRLTLKNLNITTSTAAQSLISNTGADKAAPKGLYCEDCNFKDLTKKILFLNAATYKINKIYFKSNRVEVTADNITFFSTYNAGAGSNEIENVVIDNNIWYKQGSLVKGYIYCHNLAGGMTKSISFANNTIINIAPQSSNSAIAAYIVLDSADDMAIKDNICYVEDTSTAATGTSGSCFYRTVKANINVTISGNVTYGLLPSIAWNSYVFNSATKVGQDGVGVIQRYANVPLATKDFTNGIFTPITELAGKGSNLK